MDDILTYNYYCINDDCDNSKKIHITKHTKDEDIPEYCIACAHELKQVGINVSIVHVGTQESNI